MDNAFSLKNMMTTDLRHIHLNDLCQHVSRYNVDVYVRLE